MLAEGVMSLLLDQLEAGRLIDAASRDEHVVGPERQGPVTLGARKSDAFLDQPPADAEASRRRLDVEKAQFGNLICGTHEEHAADNFSLALGDPTLLFLRIERLAERSCDLCHESLERLVPAVFLRIEPTLAMDDPSEIAAAKTAQHIGNLGFGRTPQEPLDGLHRPNEP